MKPLKDSFPNDNNGPVAEVPNDIIDPLPTTSTDEISLGKISLGKTATGSASHQAELHQISHPTLRHPSENISARNVPHHPKTARGRPHAYTSESSIDRKSSNEASLKTLGQHLLVELRKCCPKTLLDIGSIRSNMEVAAELMGATIVKSVFHHFSPWGVSGVVVIQESHLAIHTWPEFGYAALDVFTCGTQIEPEHGIDFLANCFQSQDVDVIQCYRDPSKISVFPISKRSRSTQQLCYLGTSTYQHNPEIDLPITSPEVSSAVSSGAVWSSTASSSTAKCGIDHRVIDEMLVHVPLLALPKLKTATIIGDYSKTVLAQVHKHSHITPIIISATAPNEIYNYPLTDLLLVKESAESSRSAEWYNALRENLTPEGLIVSLAPSPLATPSLFQQHLSALKVVFGPNHVTLFTAAATQSYVFFICSKNLFPCLSEINYKRADLFAAKNCLHYYTPAIHKAAFYLPAFLNRLMLESNSLPGAT